MTKVQSKNAILFDIGNDEGPLRDAMVATIGEGTAVEPGLISAIDKAKLDGIAAGATVNAADAALRDRSTHTGEQAIGSITGLVDALAGKATPADVATALAGLVDSSPATLDTLNELAAALGDDPDFATTVSTALGNRLRVDAAQGLTAPQQAQGRDNLGLGSSATAAAGDFATAAQGTKADVVFSMRYETESEFEAANIPADVLSLETAGYYASGDMGGHRKIRSSALDLFAKQAGDGSWWAPEPMPHLPVEVFGAKSGLTGIDAAANAVAFNKAAAFVKAARFGSVAAMAAVYVLGATFAPPPGLVFQGAGAPRWIPGYTAGHASFNPQVGEGTFLLFSGTGAREHVVDGISNMDIGGGVVTNPSATDPYTISAPSPDYALHDFTNGDAVGATRATLKPFSVGLKLPDGGGVILRDFAVAPYFEGVAGYGDESDAGLGDEWDMGIWFDNSSANVIDNVEAVGYWRIGSIAKTLVVKDASIPVYGEADRLINVKMQGYRGFMVRGTDTYRVTAVAANTIEIGWSASHTFETSGKVRVNAIDFAYTDLTFSGDKLTFTGISSTAGATVGAELRKAGSNFGMSGTQLIAPYITDLMHHTRLLATSPSLSAPFARMGHAIEISGEPARAIQFWGGTVIGRDDVLLFLKRSPDALFVGTYFEGQPGRATILGALSAIARGGRFIAQRTSDSSAAYPAGQTTNLRFVGCTFGPGVDRLPLVGESTGGSRFTTAGNLYKPREDFDDKRALPEYGDGDTRLLSMSSLRLMYGATGKSYIGPASGTSEVQATVGELKLESGLRVSLCGADGTQYLVANSAAVHGGTSGARTLGAASILWGQIYSNVGTISTSDGRLKQQSGPIPDEWLDAWGHVNWCRYKFNEAVAVKGEDGARWHVGLIAQQILEAFEAHGLSAFMIGLVGYDEWDEEWEDIMEVIDVLDADMAPTGETITVPTGERRKIREAGNLFSVRYDEALAMEAAWQRRELERMRSIILG